MFTQFEEFGIDKTVAVNVLAVGELQRRRRLLAAASSSFEIAAEARPLLAAASRYLSSRMKVMSIGLEDLADGALRPAQRARVPNSGGRGRGARRCRRGSFGTCFGTGLV